jgi:NMD protein affecting ribosome stability and mRNA decay
VQLSVADGIQRLNAENTKSASLSIGPKFGKCIVFVHVLGLRPFDLIEDEGECRALVGHWSTGRKTLPSATLSTTKLTWTDLRSNPDLSGERHASSYSAVNTLLSVIKTSQLMMYRKYRK